MNGPQQSWIQKWMDENGVRSLGQAEAVLRERNSLGQAIELSNETIKRGPDFASTSPHAVVTTGPLNLFGFDTCGNPGCMKSAVDRLFAQTWHYFDRVVLTSLSPLLEIPETDEEEDVLRRDLLKLIDVMLYVRDIGAEDLIEFRRPLFYCEEHLHAHGAEAGVGQVVEESEQLYLRFVDEGTVERLVEESRTVLIFRHPLRHTSRYGVYEASHAPDEATFRERAARSIVTQMVAQSVSDAFMARQLRIPLATVGDFPVRIDPATSERRSAGGVALQLSFPVLRGIPPRELLVLMRDERPHFIRFRAAVRDALKQHLLGVAEEHDPEVVAKRVYQEAIEPALASLETSIRSAKRALAKKTTVDIAVGSVATTVGLVAGMPLLASAGIAAVADVVRNAVQYFDERKDIEQDDMFFLWHAQRRAPHASS